MVEMTQFSVHDIIIVSVVLLLHESMLCKLHSRVYSDGGMYPQGNFGH